jgi:hypothetical protein
MSRLRRAEIPNTLNHDLVRTLALLQDAPPELAASTIALLGFGTRVLLAESDPPLIDMTDERPVQISITPDGWRVIEACSSYVDAAGERDSASDVPADDSWSRSHEEKLADAIDVIQSNSAPKPAEERQG